MMNSKQIRALRFLFFLSFIFLLVILFIKYQRQDTLIIGVFSGSDWDVPGTSYQKLIERAKDKFQEKYPNIKVKITEGIPVDDYSDWLAGHILRGDEPDVYLILPDDFCTLANTGNLKSLNREIINDRFDSDIFYEAAYNSGSENGVQYALPISCNPRLMFVNKTLLKKNGIDMPDNNWTWEDFYEVARELTRDLNQDGTYDQFGFYGYEWTDAVYANGENIFTNDGKDSYFSEDNFVDSLTYVRNMMKLSGGYQAQSNDFDLGIVGFRPLSFSEYRTYMPYPWRIKKFSQFEWNCLPMPAGSDGDNISYMETILIGMSAKTVNNALSWEFMKIATTDEEVQRGVYLDTEGLSPLKKVTCSDEVKEILNEDTPGGSEVNMSLLDEVMEKAVNPHHFTSYDIGLEFANSHIRDYLSDDTELNLAMFDLKKKMKKILK